MGLTDEQKDLIYRLLDYLDFPKNEKTLPEQMPRKQLIIKGAYTSTSHFDYAEKLGELPEELRQGFLRQEIKKISVDFLVYQLGDGESGEGTTLRVGGDPIWIDLEKRTVWPG